MKRVLTVLSLLLVPLLAAAENKIKMVTYFPVPYVAYSKINASKQLDVGLTSACEMNLGCAESGALGKRPLQATEVNLNRGRLDLNEASAVKSTNVTLGSGSGEANIDFSKNLRIGTLNNGYSLEATDMNVSSLTLFRSHMSSDSAAKFPSCASTGASGAPQISWQKVKLKNAEEVYLLCGTPKETKCEPPSGQSTTQSCPSGYTGTQTRTWNYSTCAWNAWQGTCTPAVKECNASSRPSSSQSCGNCGTQSRSVTCNTSTGNWVTGSWGTCQTRTCSWEGQGDIYWANDVGAGSNYVSRGSSCSCAEEGRSGYEFVQNSSAGTLVRGPYYCECY